MPNRIPLLVIVAATLTLFVLPVGPAPAADADWPCWRGVHRDGRSPDTGLLKEWPAGGPKLLWKNTSVGQGFSSAIVVGGLVYVTGDVGETLTLYALGRDGKTQWQKPVGPDGRPQHPGARSTPTHDNGKLYVLSAAGTLYCLDAKNGNKLWSKAMSEFGGRPGNWGYAESPLVYQNTVIVTPGGRSAIVALDKATGDKVWTSSGFSAGAGYGSCIVTTQPAAQTPMVIAGTADGLVAVNGRTGAKLWMDPFAARNVANCPTPVYDAGLVFWAVGYGKGGVCVKLGGPAGATRAWTTGEMVCHHGGYVVDNGYVYGNNGNGWACIELTSGQTKWTGRGVGKGSLCYADGMLYLFGEGGGEVGLAECTPTALKMKGTFRVAGSGPSWAHPIVIGGRLYVRYDTNLYCYDVKAVGQ